MKITYKDSTARIVAYVDSRKRYWIATVEVIGENDDEEQYHFLPSKDLTPHKTPVTREVVWHLPLTEGDVYRYKNLGRDGDGRWVVENGELREVQALTAEQAKAVRDAVKTTRALAAGWPPLIGTPAQVAWATDIRDRALAGVDPDACRDLARAHPDARWWIDHRDGVPLDRLNN